VARGRKVVLAVGVAVLAVSSPLASAGVGDAVSASVIAATAAAALAVPLWPGRTGGPGSHANTGVGEAD
jgi:hypothetical protein